MDYYKIGVKNAPEHTEALMAFFGVFPFDVFQETETGFDAYLPAKDFSEKIVANLKALKVPIEFSFGTEFIKGQNWNAEWEANFHPVKVDDFCGIRADFHPPFENVEHELVIQPKMAFGTGHHETTFAVIQLMQEIDFPGKKVLDYGCGTGILSILASRLGATAINAVDIEEESYLNTLENCEKNGVGNVRAIHGVLKDVPTEIYGIVLANINRNVILNSLKMLALMTKPGSLLVVSGILLGDRGLAEKSLQAHGFRPFGTKENGNWLAMKCLRF